MMIKFFLLFSLLLLLISCTSLEQNCCEECLEQSQQDPSGYDITIKECAEYRLSAECQDFFKEKPLRVGQC